LIPFGINWTVPEWLITNIPDYLNTKSAMRFNNLATKLNSTKVMTAGLQIGAKQLLEFYNTQIRVDFNDTEYTYQRVYRDLFHSIFALVNPIQELVQNTLLQLNLTPGAYTSYMSVHDIMKVDYSMVTIPLISRGAYPSRARPRSSYLPLWNTP